MVLDCTAQITWTTSGSSAVWSDALSWVPSGASDDSYPGQTDASLSDDIVINHSIEYDIQNGFPTYSSAKIFSGTVTLGQSGVVFTIGIGSQFYMTSWGGSNGAEIQIDGGHLICSGISFQANINANFGAKLIVTGAGGAFNETLIFNSSSTMELWNCFGPIVFSGNLVQFNTTTAFIETGATGSSIFGFGSRIRFAEGASFYKEANSSRSYFPYGVTPIFETGFSTSSGWRQMSAPLSTTLNEVDNLPHITINNSSANIYTWDPVPDASGIANGWTRVTNASAGFGGGNSPATIYVTPNTSGSYQPSGTVRVQGSPGNAFYDGDPNFTFYYSHDPLGDMTNTDRGWNLVPNPYPSNLDLQGVSDGFNLTYKAIHTWDVSASQYKVYLNSATQITHSNSPASSTSAQYARPWQAFWVKMENGDGSTAIKTITRSMRSDGVTSADYFKAEGNEDAKLRLFIRSSDTSAIAQTDEALVYFNMNSSKAFEPAYDAIKKFSDVYGTPSLYMRKYDENNDATPISIYSNSFVEDSKVPVYFRSGEAGTYILSFAEEGGFAKDVRVIDHKLNTRTLFTGQEFQFDYSPTDNDHRFTLEFSRKNDNGSSADASLTPGENGTTSIEDFESESGLLNNTFVQAEELIVAFNLVETSGAELIVEVVDLTGRTVFSQKVNGSENLRIPMNEFSYSKFLLVTVSQVNGSDKESRKVVLW